MQKSLMCWSAVAVGFASIARGQVFDGRAQFSTTTNPAGAWSYGWQPAIDAGFTLLTHQTVVGGGASFWDLPGSPPSIGKNISDHPILIADNPVVRAGVTMFHPGPNNQRGVVRWTAPAAGSANVFIHVGGVAIDPEFASTDVAILLNGSILAASSNYNNAFTYSFYQRVEVLPGSTIDLSQGFGTNGSYLNDSTAFRFTVVLNQCIADLNADGVVDDSDFAVFAPAYNILDCADPAMSPGCPADINHDGVVDDVDFGFFVPQYNALVCP